VQYGWMLMQSGTFEGHGSKADRISFQEREGKHNSLLRRG